MRFSRARAAGSPTCRSSSASTRTSRRRRTSVRCRPLRHRPFRARPAIRRALEVVDLYDARHRLARDLSGGMQRRLELACALVHGPEVLFVDEPTAGIDPILRAGIWDELRSLRDEGRTLLVTTQYVAEAEYCDRVALIVDGELVASTRPTRCARWRSAATCWRSRRTRAVDPEMLANVPGIKAFDSRPPRQLFVTTEDAATHDAADHRALRAAGVAVAGIEEHQPTFDEVFTAWSSGAARQREAGRRPSREVAHG